MNPLGILSWWKPALISGGAALIMGTTGGFYVGNRLGDAKVDRVNNHTLIRNQILRIASDKIGAEVGTKTAEREAQVRIVTRILERQVPTYVPLKGSCDIAPSGFVSLLDAAALGRELPSTPAEPADTPSGIGFDQVGAVTVSNLGICRENALRLEGLQDWVKQMQRLYGAGSSASSGK